MQLFRLANATLYSLPIPPEATAALEGDETTRVAAANEFLVELQSRNVRRKILSLQQRYRDQQHLEQQQTSIGHEGISNRNSRRRRKPGEVNHEASGVSSETGVQIEMGSSWLAFLAVLCQMQPDGSSFISFPPERLFAAQSVLHRARRNKLVDAVDLEVESESQWLDESTALGMYRDTQFVTPMLHAYQQCMTVWNPFVADVLHHCYFQNRRNTETREEDDEEQVKGEIMLLTLASCSYITACQPAEAAQRTAILEALGSAIATISLRIRYLKNSHNNQPPPSSPLAAGSTPSSDTAQNLSSSDHSSLVWMISEAFHHVFDRAQAFHLDPLALSTSLTLTLGALPDTILSSPGGARGRLSVDPRSLEAAVTELRGRGFHDLWTALQHVGSLLSLNNSNNNHTAHPFLVLTTLEKWARFLCVPQEKVNEISSLLSQFLSSNEPKDHAAALLFLTSVFEGGRWTEEQVLSFGLGLSGHQLVLGKKKQSSRSRRRHKEMVSNKTSNNNVEQAQREVVERGAVACQVAVAIWSPLNTLFRSVLDATLEPGEVDGEGPIGCVATATHTCLPFLLLLKQQEMPRGHELFQQLAHALVQLCSSSNQTVRSLAFPPIYALYRAAVSKCREQQEQSASNSHQDDFVLDILPQVSTSRLETYQLFEYVLTNITTKCLTKLAAACFYPTDYFVDLRAESDEELEIHRNEVRDLFRALTGGEDEEGHEVPLPSLQLLHRTTKSLWQEMQKTQHHPPETYVHTLSALAKPLGRLVRQWLSTGRTEPQDSRLFVLQESSEQCLVQVLEILATSLLRISTLFHDSPNMQVVLPLSRTLNIAVASMAPVLGALASSSVTQSSVAKVLPLATRLALLSLRFLPELATSEKLVYEIRGTMRGPGGEDHVGSLSLMRLTTENEALTSLLVQSVAPDMKDICATHEYLKSVEQCWDESSQNPRTVPKSRRNLLGVICRLEVSSRGQAGASEMLTSLVHSSVSLILSVDTNRLSEQSFFMLCETCHDLAALAPLFAPSFFDQGENKKSLETLRLAAVQQYMTLIHDLEIDGTIQQVRPVVRKCIYQRRTRYLTSVHSGTAFVVLCFASLSRQVIQIGEKQQPLSPVISFWQSVSLFLSSSRLEARRRAQYLRIRSFLLTLSPQVSL